MHIFITGTRGIPARYGGFETFAQELSRRLVKKGHAVTVCNPSSHPRGSPSWEGVEILRRSWPALPGGVLWYDRLCLRAAYRRRPDVILNCGYGNAVFIRRKDPVPVVTLTDGLEWQRAGWRGPARWWLRKMEKSAVKRSRQLVSDHPEIARHYREHYGLDTPVIPYGADIPRDLSLPAGASLSRLVGKATGKPVSADIEPEGYFLTIARFVPENNLAMILEGHLRAAVPYPLVLVGDAGTRYGKKLRKKYGRQGKVLFTGSLYDKPLLDLLRHHARGYLHGHSAGGTNPALLEAMAAGSLIAAHDNPFNRYILQEEAVFFSTAGEVAELLAGWDALLREKNRITAACQSRIHKTYSWEKITEQYEELLEKVTAG